jgi:predicted phage tail component-like protein
MYEFVDFSEPGTLSTSLSIQTIFNGINLDEALSDHLGSFTTLTVSGRSNLSNRINAFEIPGREGLMESSEVTSKEKEITIKYKISDSTNEGFRQRYNRLNTLLKGSKKELIFTDEDATFNATLSSNDVPEEDSNILIGSITFFCSDPNKYGRLKDPIFTNLASPITLHNGGTVPTPPTFRFVLSQSTTYLDIIGDENYMRIGRPVSVDQTPFQKYTKILKANGENMTGWANALFSPDGGTNSGTMNADGLDYYASAYGSGTSWHGPTKSRSTLETASDYLIRAFFNVGNNPSQRARTEVYLLNASSQVIGKVSVVLRKSTGGVDVEINLRNGANSKYIVSMDWTYSDFFGYMDLEKEGTDFKFSVAQQGLREDGSNYTRHKQTFSFNDLNNEFQQDLAAVGMHIGTHSDFPAPSKARIRLIEVYKINTEPEGIPYIGEPGDVFEFNHKESKIYKNGDPFTDKDFGARFFHLQEGDNVFVINPSNVVSEVQAIWRDAFQ